MNDSRKNLQKYAPFGVIFIFAALTALYVTSFVPFSYADTVFLKNGGKLEGKVTEEGDKVTIETKWGPITVPKGTVEKIVREGEKEDTGLSFPPTGEKKSAKKDGKKASGAKDAPEKSSASSRKSSKDLLKDVTKSITSKEITGHVNYLASQKLEGRASGTNGGKLAAKYLAKEFKKYGLKPGAGGNSYLQEFRARGGSSWNVIGYIRGEDSAAREQVVVIGGHYDHVGKSRGGKFCPGSDDNASGTAGVLEIAEAFSEKKLPNARTIVFVCFGAEEVGLVGSKKYVQDPTFPIANTVAMVNLDMISRNSPDSLIVYNAGPEWDAVLEEANKHGGFKINRSKISASDHASFQRAGVPVAFFCTGMHRDLHKPSDTPDKSNFKKSERIAETVCLVALQLASKEGKFGKTSKEDMEKELGGKLGILTGITDIPEELRKKYKIPEDNQGIIVEKIIKDSAAAKAKLREGDILIEFGGKGFPGSGALMEFEKMVDETPAGEKVDCVVLRKGTRKKLSIKIPED